MSKGYKEAVLILNLRRRRRRRKEKENKAHSHVKVITGSSLGAEPEEGKKEK